jgi:phenylacetic acid degradation operon negative regulatory protein
LVEPLGINQRLVRTSVFRLAEKGILQSYQQGRRSYYSLTERGLRQFQSATRRIYAAAASAWDGNWCLVMTALGELTSEQREAVRKELTWLGFSRLRPGFYAHPGIDTMAVQTMLEDRQINEQVVMLHAFDPIQTGISNQLIARCFDTNALSNDYHTFLDDFQPLLEAAQQVQRPEPQLAFLVRTLLIHKYRYILLHEPELPNELLPEHALNHQARQVAAQLYQSLRESSDRFFLSVAEKGGQEPTFKTPDIKYEQRFKI